LKAILDHHFFEEARTKSVCDDDEIAGSFPVDAFAAVTGIGKREFKIKRFL
jgi:hypothetical protein